MFESQTKLSRRTFSRSSAKPQMGNQSLILAATAMLVLSVPMSGTFAETYSKDCNDVGHSQAGAAITLTEPTASTVVTWLVLTPWPPSHKSFRSQRYSYSSPSLGITYISKRFARLMYCFGESLPLWRRCARPMPKLWCVSKYL